MEIVIAILVFCVIIIIHELGHFFAAKACGIYVREFALGMGDMAVFQGMSAQAVWVYAYQLFRAELSPLHHQTPPNRRYCDRGVGNT